MRLFGLLTVVGECRVSVENGIKSNNKLDHVMSYHVIQPNAFEKEHTYTVVSGCTTIWGKNKSVVYILIFLFYFCPLQYRN